MAIKINSNGQSLAAQRQVAQTGDALSRVFERLSSGQRINRASDDAAGLAVASGLNAKGRIIRQASKNINDGISLLQITESALRSQISITGRLSELAEQSANGIYTDKQRTAINNEYQALVSEYTRIGQTTSFNGITPLKPSGKSEKIDIQVGADGSADSSISVNQDASTAVSGVLSISGDFNGDGTTTIADINYLAGLYGTISADDYSRITQGQAGTFQILNNLGQPTTVYTAIAGIDGNTNLLFAFLRNNDGSYQTIGSKLVSYDSSTGELTGSKILNFAATSGIPKFSVELTGLKIINSTPFGQPGNVTPPTSTLGFSNVSTVTEAKKALDIISSANSSLSNQIATLGAASTRLAFAFNLNSSQYTAIEESEKRITDTDVGSESTSATRLSILQQAGAAVLAQANLQPKIALKLLQDL